MSVQRLQIYIEVSGNKEPRTLELLADLRNYEIQGGGIARRKVAARHFPAAPAHHQMEAGNC